MLLRAHGPALDLLVTSRVASYLQFGLVGGVGLVQADPAPGTVKRVPASKSDVFTDQTLSLVEKRRLTKLLLFAAGQDPLEHDPVLQAGRSLSFLTCISSNQPLTHWATEPGLSFVDYLQKGFSLSGPIADSLTYALALCTSPSGQSIAQGYRGTDFFVLDQLANTPRRRTQIQRFRPWTGYGASSTPSGDTDLHPTS